MYLGSYRTSADRGKPGQWQDHSSNIYSLRPSPRLLPRHSMDNGRPYNENWDVPLSDLKSNKYPDDRWPEGMRLHDRYPPTTTESEPDDSEGNPKTIKRVFTRFGERTSMQGIPYINASKTWYAKLTWVLLSFIAIGVMVFHLYYLFSTFFGFPYQSRVTLGFDNLNFPAVTFCNVNPVRNSMLYLGSKQLKTYVHDIRPERIVTSMKQFAPPQPNGNTPTPTSNPQSSGTNGNSAGTTQAAQQSTGTTRSTRASTPGTSGNSSGTTQGSRQPTGTRRTTNSAGASRSPTQQIQGQDEGNVSPKI